MSVIILILSGFLKNIFMFPIIQQNYNIMRNTKWQCTINNASAIRESGKEQYQQGAYYSVSEACRVVIYVLIKGFQFVPGHRSREENPKYQ